MKKIIFIFIGLYSLNAFAYYTENIPNQCGVIDNIFHAIFTPNQYTCSAGEFLPAHTEGCESCPDDYTCSGGTYTFNENMYQGAVKSSTYITHDMTNICSTKAPHNLTAVFTPNVHNCSAGYYLPANVDACTICPENSYCSGGTYTFNETITQGIESCPSGYPNSESGSSVSTDCFRTSTAPHAVSSRGGIHYNGVDGDGVDATEAVTCEDGYNLQNNVCVGNTITIIWNNASLADINANNAGTMTYAGDIRTPRAASAPPKGMFFRGWKFRKPTQQ